MKNLLICIFFCLITIFAVQAQQNCPAVPFIAYNGQNQPVQTFCVGERITFKDNSGESNVTEFYDFDDRDAQNFTSTSHTFTVPGRYVVTQLKGVGRPPCSIAFEVKAIPPATAPVLQSLILEPTGIRIKVQSSAINDLVVERAPNTGGTFTSIETLRSVPVGQSEHFIPTNQISGCFRVQPTNLCTTGQPFNSNVICAQSLTVTAGDRQNILTWPSTQTPIPITNYQVLRGGQVYQTLPSSQQSFTDNQVACGRLYTYALVALLSDGTQSTSLPRQLQTTGTTPPVAPLLVASFNLQNNVQLQSIIPEQATYKEQTVYRGLNGGVLGIILEKQAQNTIDTQPPDFSQRPCYQAAYLDSCNLLSPRSNLACPSILRAILQPETGAVRLTWTPYEGFPEGIASQTLELLDEQGNVYWSTEVSGQSFLDIQPQQEYQRLTYRLRTKARNATYESFSNTASLDQPFQFFFPTAFSPNGDGLNDTFRAVGRFASSFNLQVLNRWGQVIFESKSPQEGWDGTYKGKPSPPETYLYRFEATDVNGERITKSGKVTLVR